jgi:hypothetical protein
MRTFTIVITAILFALSSPAFAQTSKKKPVSCAEFCAKRCQTSAYRGACSGMYFHLRTQAERKKKEVMFAGSKPN